MNSLNKTLIKCFFQRTRIIIPVLSLYIFTGFIKFAHSSCGNNIIEVGEACDGTSFQAGQQCSLYPGFSSGNLTCNQSCTGFDFSACSKGQSIQATSCLQTDVQTAINQAVDGDTVLIPAGTCDWSTPNSCAGLQNCAPVKIVNKNITLKGAGPTQTIIQSQVSGTNWDRTTLYVEPSTTKPFRISGIKFMSGEGGPGIISINGNTKNFRVDNVVLEGFLSHGIFISGDISGVIDHSTFTTQINAQCGFVRGPKNAWKKGARFGLGDNVFFEDCVFIHSNTIPFGAIDGDDGSRYVVRNSTAINSHIFYHGPEVAGLRGGLSLEIYNNVLMSRGNTPFTFIDVWGGTGVFFNNKMVGNATIPLMIQYRRSCAAYPVFGQCQTGNSYDGTGTNGYPCLDQIGRSMDTDPNALQPQQSDPLYEWGNKLNGANVDFQLNQPCPEMVEHVKVNRDYFNDTPRPNYQQYPYPHPLSLMEENSPTNGGGGNGNNGDGSDGGQNTSRGSSTIEMGFTSFKNFFNPQNESLTINTIGLENGTQVIIVGKSGDEVQRLDLINNQVKWDGRNSSGHAVAAGTYILILKSVNNGVTKKIVVVK